ncbi:MAG: hypothetical protein ABWZ90_01155 [Acidimicrobiales bacterium]
MALLQTVLVQGQIHLDGLHADVAARQAEVQLLREAVSEAESPAHIRDVAINQLGMVEPPVRYILPGPEAGAGSP